MSLTVDPGQTYVFTATREVYDVVSLKRSSRTPKASRKKPFFGLRNAFLVDHCSKPADLGMSARIIQGRPI